MGFWRLFVYLFWIVENEKKKNLAREEMEDNLKACEWAGRKIGFPHFHSYVFSSAGKVGAEMLIQNFSEISFRFSFSETLL